VKPIRSPGENAAQDKKAASDQHPREPPTYLGSSVRALQESDGHMNHQARRGSNKNWETRGSVTPMSIGLAVSMAGIGRLRCTVSRDAMPPLLPCVPMQSASFRAETRGSLPFRHSWPKTLLILALLGSGQPTPFSGASHNKGCMTVLGDQVGRSPLLR
jgi:hypothetical protein